MIECVENKLVLKLLKNYDNLSYMGAPHVKSTNLLPPLPEFFSNHESTIPAMNIMEEYPHAPMGYNNNNSTSGDPNITIEEVD